jgi:Ca2+-binding EF-hand superfamily protein
MKKLLVTLALGAAVVSTPSLAQGFGGGQRDQTRAEAQQRADMIFQMIDANHDGVVTRDEAQQAAAQFGSRGGDNGRGGGRMQRMIDEAFGSAQSLTLQQFEAQALARFEAEDLNHDGLVTAAERQQVREMRQANGQAPGAPQPVPTPLPPRQ